jgi:hypothetical protein
VTPRKPPAPTAPALERPGRLREGPRPPLGSWLSLYALVALELVAFIARLAWLTRRFS